MIPYFCFYFLSFLSSFFYAKSQKKSSIIFFCIQTFLLLFLPIAFRYGIGTDYFSYVDLVQKGIQKNDFSTFEIGWAPIIWFIGKTGVSIHTFFIIPAFFSILILFMVIPRKYFYICIPAYMSLAYLESFCVVRQAFAACILLLSVRCFIKEKRIWSCIWLVVAVLFHKSALLFAPLLLLSELKWKLMSRWNNAFFLFVIVIAFMVGNFAFVFMEKVVGNTIYSVYVMSEYNEETKLGSGLGVLLKLLIFLIVLYFSEHKNREEHRQYKIVCLSVFSLAAGQILAAQIHIFGRIPNLFSPFYVYFLLSIATSHSKYKKICVSFVLISLFFIFFKNLQVSDSSLKAGLGVVPYRTIFSE